MLDDLGEARPTPTTRICACTCCGTGSSSRTGEPGRRLRGALQRRLEPPARSPSTRSSALRPRRGQPCTSPSIDKFPRMTDYVAPKGVRIADADRVRLGAHLAEGTTVMHEGFVNFNAGTLGTSMVEGRISAGVVVGDGSDIGGGASTMGTLSGGGNAGSHRRALPDRRRGRRRDRARRRVYRRGGAVRHGRDPGHDARRPDRQGARALQRDNILFRRNSQTGAVEAMQRTGSVGGPEHRAARQRLRGAGRGALALGERRDEREAQKPSPPGPRTTRGGHDAALEQAAASASSRSPASATGRTSRHRRRGGSRRPRSAGSRASRLAR